MSPEEVQTIIEKLEDILRHLKNQNSGADIHTVGNIRNTTSLLIEQLKHDPECLDEALIRQIAHNCERDLIEFYKKKYSQPRTTNEVLLN